MHFGSRENRSYPIEGGKLTVQKTEQARYRRQRPVVRAARADARALADKWQHPELADDLAQLVTEVITNAVIHGTAGRGSQVHVTYRLLGDRLRVDVRDAATGQPRVMRSTSLGGEPREYGRGLILVATLADRWGMTPRVIGKSVWFELVLSSRDAATQEADR
ncbi:ATP-binding protein [Streptomyces sp. NPDC057144]|uniref:ATP-binding protein n=1 Tax=Streptomyces sp. NPDC057144 TaxID=3346034 RepID=UPI00363CFC8C